MANCTTCGRAIFDEIFGEYKCEVWKHIIYDPEIKEGCPHYKEGKPKTSTDKPLGES